MSNLPPNSNADDVHGSVPHVSPKSTDNVHGSVPNVSPNPAADVHGSADSQNVNNIIPYIEELKGHLKTYARKTSIFRLIQAHFSLTNKHVDFSGKNGEHQIVDDAGDVAKDGVGVSVNEGEQLVSDTPKNITSSQYLLTDSQLPIDIPITEIVVRTDSVTHAHRKRMPSRRIQSPYCTSFGSSEKGKEKLKDMARLHFPFEGCGITDQVSPKLTEDYMNWLTRGLLKNHNNKNPSDDNYRSKSSSFGFTMMDFVVAFPMNKN
ncbi:uncharacterized protein [Solanum lycopersicum]|uniref:uncharacterized protein n=1 Tax=Solanum lycopersicum TaxID=4081 RepID=UPI003748DDC1